MELLWRFGVISQWPFMVVHYHVSVPFRCCGY